MSTARTTPAQKPRGLIRSSTFPFFSVGIVILKYSFARIYHTSLSCRCHLSLPKIVVIEAAQPRPGVGEAIVHFGAGLKARRKPHCRHACWRNEGRSHRAGGHSRSAGASVAEAHYGFVRGRTGGAVVAVDSHSGADGGWCGCVALTS